MKSLKVITVRDTNYQLRKMDPTAGSFLYLRMMGVLMLAQQEVRSDLEVDDKDLPKLTDEQKARMLITTAVMRGLSFQDLQFAHKQALVCVAKSTAIGESTGWLPIMTADGRWADKSVADDASLVNELVIEALVYSLQPFFAVSGNSSAIADPASTNQ